MHAFKQTAVQVAIVTYNRAEYLRQCLAALRAQTYPIIHITVINNCSTDHTSLVLQDAIDQGMPLLEHKTSSNLGGAGGFAKAFELAMNQDADWVWVMDDDVEAAPNCLERLIENSQECAVVQPNRYHDGGEFLEIYQRVNVQNPFGSLLQAPIRLRPSPSQSRVEIGFFPFEGPLIRQTVMQRLGVPEAEYFLFCDDVEYSVRVSKDGGRIAFCPDAVMRRMIRATVDKNFGWRNYFDFRNRIWLDKTHSGWAFACLRGLLWMLWQWVSCVRRGRDAMSYRVIWCGTKDGLLGVCRSLSDIQRMLEK